MASSAVGEENCENLSDLFKKIWSAYEELENTAEPTNSDNIQSLVQTAISSSEKAIHMVNDLSLFSTNESVDEVSTKELRFLLLPALLGYFMNKTTKIDRFEAVKKSQVYFIDFLRLCKLYGLTDCKLPKPFVSPTDDTSINAPSVTQTSQRVGPVDVATESRRRQEKIERYRRQKELRQKLEELVVHTKQEHADEELLRRYYLTLLDKWLAEAFENLDSIETELPLLEHMSRMKEKNGEKNEEQHEQRQKSGEVMPECCHGNHHHHGNNKPKQAMRPFIITKDEMQRAVFGLGYPGIPTVSVGEFYAQRVRDGIFPTHEASASQAALAAATSKEEKEEAEEAAREKEKEEKEKLLDDDVEVDKARNWDDWKDDHRRGWGNTQNKG